MLDPELKAKLDEIQAVAERAFVAAEKSRKYLFWTGVVSIVIFVLPIVGLFFAIPYFLHSYLGGFQPYLNTTPSGQPSAQSQNSTPAQEAQLLQQLGI